MSLYEFLTVALAGTALTVSAWTARRQRAFEQSQSQWVEAQRQALLRDQETQTRADVRARIVRFGKNGRVEIKNHGRSSARNIGVTSTRPKAEWPIPPFVAEKTFPIAELKPDERITVLSLPLSMLRDPVRMTFTWDDESGRGRQQEIALRIDDAGP